MKRAGRSLPQRASRRYSWADRVTGKDCLAWADRVTGKLTDGPQTQFRCYI